MNFFDLPDDVLGYITAFLSPQGAAAFSQSNSTLFRIVGEQRLRFMIQRAGQLYQQQLTEAEKDFEQKKQAEDDEIANDGFVMEATQDARIRSEEAVQKAKDMMHLPLPNAQTTTQADIEEGLKNPSYAQDLFAYLSIIPSQASLAWFVQQYQILQNPFCLHHFLQNKSNGNTQRIIEVLLALGANPNLIDDEQRNALHYATLIDNEYSYTYINILNFLLHFGADPRAQDAEDNTPAHLFAQHAPEFIFDIEEYQLMRQLIAVLIPKEIIFLLNNAGLNLLRLLPVYGRAQTYIRALLALHYRQQHPEIQSMQPWLFTAIDGAFIDDIHALLTEQPGLISQNFRTHALYAPLDYALHAPSRSMRINETTVLALLAHHPDKDCFLSLDQRFPLYLCAKHFLSNAMQTLIDDGADINKCSEKDGNTALHALIKSALKYLHKPERHFEILSALNTLLSYPILNPNIPNDEHFTVIDLIQTKIRNTDVAHISKLNDSEQEGFEFLDDLYAAITQHVNFRADEYADPYIKAFFSNTMSDDESIPSSLPDTQIYLPVSKQARIASPTNTFSQSRFFTHSPVSTETHSTPRSPTIILETDSEEERAPSRMSEFSF